MTKSSVYNCYKLLGFDLLLDEDLKVHVIEANARPALLDDHLDRAVNRPMVNKTICDPQLPMHTRVVYD